MDGAALDNPVWSSLVTVHRARAAGGPSLLRFPRDVGPFLGVPDPGPVDEELLRALVEPGEIGYFVGVRPELSSRWELTQIDALPQMVRTEPLPEVPGPEVVPLGPEHRERVLSLTALVYPHFFRERTLELGRFRGVLEDDRLLAMVGERFALPGHREVSALCTHPEALGRGLARRLMAVCTNTLLAEGALPFLHVSSGNQRARRLYEETGWTTRAFLPFWRLRRAAA